MIYDLQKASMWKRISAAMFDGILLGIAAVLFAWLLSLALGFDGGVVRYTAAGVSQAPEALLDTLLNLLTAVQGC